MAILTELPFDAARRLLAGYGLTLLELEALRAGSVNSNFFLRVRGSAGHELSLFARLFEEQAEAGAEFELLLNEQLSDSGLPVARPIRTDDGALCCSYLGKPFAVYERLEGEVSCQARVNGARCFAVGQTLARVHVAPLSGLALEPSRFGFEQIRERLARVQLSGRPSLLPVVEELRQGCDQLEAKRDATLPQGLIHGDLFRDNVLLSGDTVAGLLDFESASRGSYVYDLMVTILAWCFGSQLEPDLVRAMLQGYASVRPLSAQEGGEMVLEGEVACLRFATTRLTDFTLRVPEGHTPGRDYRRFLARKDALRSGLIERLLAEL